MLAPISGHGSGPKSRKQKLKGLMAEVKFLVGENPVRISRRRSMGMLQAPQRRPLKGLHQTPLLELVQAKFGGPCSP